MITQCAHVERNKTFIWVNKNNNLKSHFRNFWKCNLNREAEMFTPRGPVAGSFQHTLWPRERALEVATLVSRAFAFVFSWYKVIIALSLYFSSWALQHTVHISIIAAKIVSLEFFSELQYFGPDLRLARTKTAIPIRSVQNADCRLQTGYKLQTRYKCRLQTGYKMQTQNLYYFFVWYVITCHPTSYRASHNRFSVIIFDDYLYHCRIFLALFLITTVLKPSYSLLTLRASWLVWCLYRFYQRNKSRCICK